MGTREQNRAEREKNLVAATSAAIAELGFSAVRVSDIAERAGMTPGHVSYYFPTKSELLMLAIRSSEAELLREASASIARLIDPWQRLEQLIELSVAREVRDPGWTLWLEVWAAAINNQDVAAGHHELDSRWRELLSDVVEAGMRSGAFRKSPLADTVMLISTAFDGLSVQLTVGTPGFTAARLRRLAGELCAALLTPEAGKR